MTQRPKLVTMLKELQVHAHVDANRTYYGQSMDLVYPDLHRGPSTAGNHNINVVGMRLQWLIRKQIRHNITISNRNATFDIVAKLQDGLIQFK